ncbi:MAG: hypothetical protein ACI9HY_002470, partial [Planctomycetaceae bacterium]
METFANINYDSKYEYMPSPPPLIEKVFEIHVKCNVKGFGKQLIEIILCLLYCLTLRRAGER